MKTVVWGAQTLCKCDLRASLLQVVSVEENKPTSDPQAIRRLMESNGFCFYQSVYEKGLLLDNIYVQTSLCEKLKK